MSADLITPVFPTSIDSTMLSCYTDCPQKFYVEYMLRLAPQARSPDLHAGGAIAAGMEAARKAFYFKGVTVQEAIYEGWYALTAYWGDYIPPENHAKDYITVANAFVHYWNHFNPETDPLRPVNLAGGASAIEFNFAIPTEVKNPITGDPILYSGRIDLAGQRDGRVMVVDEKTTKSLGPSFYQKWSMRGQFLGYCYAMNTLHGIQCEHAMIRAIVLQKTQVMFEEFIQPVPFFKQERWWDATQQKIREIVGRWEWMQSRREELAEKYDWPNEIERITQMNGVSHDIWTYAFAEPCEQFGGCMFRQLCGKENPHLGYENYETRIWDPLAKDPTAKNVNSLEGMSRVEIPDEMKELMK